MLMFLGNFWEGLHLLVTSYNTYDTNHAIVMTKTQFTTEQDSSSKLYKKMFQRDNNTLFRLAAGSLL